MAEFKTKLHHVYRRHSWNHFWMCDCHSLKVTFRGWFTWRFSR